MARTHLVFLMILGKQTEALSAKVETLKLTLQQLSAPERELLDLVEEQNRVSIAWAVAATGAHRETVRKRMAGLVKKGFLEIDGKGRGAAYRKR